MKSETIELDFVNDLMTAAERLDPFMAYSNIIVHVKWQIMLLAHMIAIQVMNREFKYSLIVASGRAQVEQQVMEILIILDPKWYRFVCNVTLILRLVKDFTQNLQMKKQ